MCGNTTSQAGTGGMKTKLEAARICLRAGIPMIIANGENPENINKALAGDKIGTIFVPNNKEVV
jgi:glutamate 5-kinase